MPADLGIFPVYDTARRSPAGEAPHLHPATAQHWHALLGCRWQEHHAKVTELSCGGRDAVCIAAEAESPDVREAALLRASGMWHQAVAEWRALAEIEAALLRLATGQFGRCQQCGGAIPLSRLADIPQAQHCPACDQ